MEKITHNYNIPEAEALEKAYKEITDECSSRYSSYVESTIKNALKEAGITFESNEKFYSFCKDRLTVLSSLDDGINNYYLDFF